MLLRVHHTNHTCRFRYQRVIISTTAIKITVLIADQCLLHRFRTFCEVGCKSYFYLPMKLSFTLAPLPVALVLWPRPSILCRRICIFVPYHSFVSKPSRVQHSVSRTLTGENSTEARIQHWFDYQHHDTVHHQHRPSNQVCDEVERVTILILNLILPL